MSSSGWDQMADWWDKHLGDEGDLWHRTLIDPPLLRLVGEVSGMRVLDLACGNGYLSRRFARQGAIVTSVDANAPIIELARAREAQEPLGIIYHVSDAAHLEMLEDNFLIWSSATWRSWILRMLLEPSRRQLVCLGQRDALWRVWLIPVSIK